MPKFRVIPMEIDAFQMTEDVYWKRDQWPEWMQQKHANGDKSEIFFELWMTAETYILSTPDISARICLNDWVVCRSDGTLAICKPELFQKTFEPVETPHDTPDV